MQITTKLKVTDEMRRRLAEVKEPDEETLREQRISFVYGQMMGRSTKEHVRQTASRIRLLDSRVDHD